jgi:hypothetical protein
MWTWTDNVTSQFEKHNTTEQPVIYTFNCVSHTHNTAAEWSAFLLHTKEFLWSLSSLPCLFKIKIKTRPFVDAIGARPPTKTQRKHSLRPYGKIRSKSLSNPRRLSQVPHIGIRFISFPWRNNLQWARTSSLSRFHTTFDMTPLEEWSVRRRDLYLTTHNTHNRQTSKHPAGLEPTIPASEWPQIHALDRAATAIGIHTSE